MIVPLIATGPRTDRRAAPLTEYTATTLQGSYPRCAAGFDDVRLKNDQDPLTRTVFHDTGQPHEKAPLAEGCLQPMVLRQSGLLDLAQGLLHRLPIGAGRQGRHGFADEPDLFFPEQPSRRGIRQENPPLLVQPEDAMI